MTFIHGDSKRMFWFGSQRKNSRTLLIKRFKLIVITCIISTLCVVAFTGVVFAQDEKKSANPADKLLTGGTELADALGSDVTLEVNAKAGGEVVTNISTKDGKFESLIAKVDVKLTSDQMSLSCDKLIFEGEKKVITAIADAGKTVSIKVQGINATAGKFVYDVEKRKAELSINPVVSQGAGTSMKAPLIIIEQDENGKTSVIAKKAEGEESQPEANGDGKIIFKLNTSELQKKSKENKSDEKKPSEPNNNSEKITPENIGKIPEPPPTFEGKEGEITDKL